MLTSSQIENDILALLQGSSLLTEVSGKIYRRGYRPRDSRREDIIVSFIDGTPGQIEQGAVTVNIYVADLTPYKNGQYVKNGPRLAEIEQMAKRWVNSLTAERTNYRFSLLRTIRTIEDEELHQHYVTVQLEYNYFSNQSEK